MLAKEKRTKKKTKTQMTNLLKQKKPQKKFWREKSRRGLTTKSKWRIQSMPGLDISSSPRKTYLEPLNIQPLGIHLQNKLQPKSKRNGNSQNKNSSFNIISSGLSKRSTGNASSRTQILCQVCSIHIGINKIKKPKLKKAKSSRRLL